MKRFKFGLQRVLDYRKTVEDSKLGELAAIRAECEMASRQMSEMMTEKEKYIENMRTILTNGSPDDIRQSYRFLQELDDRIIVHRIRLADLEQAENDKLEEVMVATMDRKAMERLKDYKMVEHKQQMGQAEQQFLDEIAGMAYSRNRSVEEQQLKKAA